MAIRRRNSRADQEFLDAAARDMRVDWETGLLVWSGDPEDIGSSYQLPPDSRRCMGSWPVTDDMNNPVLHDKGNGSPLEALRRRCPKWALAGSHMCIDHKGGAGNAVSAAKERLIRSADAAVGMLVQLALDKSVSPADRIKALNSVLDRAGVRPGVEVDVTTKGWEKVLQNLMEGGQDNGHTETETPGA